MAIERVGFPINSMVIFHSKMLVHQRVDSNACSGSVLFCSDQLLVLNLELAIYAPRS